ncbi:MAG TPA: SNF2-related protein, partial [Gemmatimonadales bacterium]|nr:SNF2-related protein [Gemmatimonadales bacterium]
MPPTAARLPASSRILAERLVTPADPLAWLLAAREEAPAAAVSARAARALLDLPEISPLTPPWLAPHQAPAAARITALLDRFGGALLADAVGLGKSYVALAVAVMREDPIAVITPAVLADQWRALLTRRQVEAPLVTTEALSTPQFRAGSSWRTLTYPPQQPRLLIVDEAHRFRNPGTIRYRNLALLVTGARVLLLTATPVHNRLADLLHLFRLFLRDDALTGLGLASLRRAALSPEDPERLAAVLPRLVVARSRRTATTAYPIAAAGMRFPRRSPALVVRAAPAPAPVVRALADGIVALGGAGGRESLVRLMLLRRLSSSVPALRASLLRQQAYSEFARELHQEGRRLATRDFQRIFPRGEEDDLQLAFLPLLVSVTPGPTPPD